MGRPVPKWCIYHQVCLLTINLNISNTIYVGICFQRVSKYMIEISPNTLPFKPNDQYSSVLSRVNNVGILSEAAFG